MRLSIFLFTTIFLTPLLGVSGQTIQLPSISSFSVDTTVLVPDSAGAATARIKRGSSSSSSFGGFPKQRAAAANRQAAGMHVLAKIHDPLEADKGLLNKQAATRAATGIERVAVGPARTAARAKALDEPGLKSVAEIERQRANQLADKQRDAQALFEKGRQAQAAGKTGVAAVYLRSAAGRATGALKHRIDADLKSLKEPGNAPTTASAER